MTEIAMQIQKAGVDVIGDMVGWGTHFCLFYETKKDLLDASISYCKAGLEKDEYCLWIVAEPLTIAEATLALKEAVPHVDRHIADSSLEIMSARDWFLQGGAFDGKRVRETMYEKLTRVSARGYPGVRVTGDTTWLTKKDWAHYCEIEESINEVIGDQRLSVLCTFPLAACGAFEILDTVRTHQFALTRRHETWEVIETAGLKRAKDEIKRLNEALEQRVVERTSELMQASEKLRNAQAHLAHMTRLMTMGELTASIAHEVNQPLFGITTNADTCLLMLSSDPPDIDGARETAQRTIRDANRASDVIQRLRALYSKKDPSPELMDLNQATREVISFSLSDLQRCRVILLRELADDLPLVMADRVQVQQVIMNLLRNASDAMSNVDDHPRELLIKTEREEGDRVRLSVKDAGVGFEPQTADRLFEAFYTTKNEGMGIGLSISHSIIEAHEGRLWATANDGPGATFSFSIPCRATSLVAEETRRSRPDGAMDAA